MEKLINHLKNEVYVRIGVSKIKGAGVGVIAIRDIPKGINPFKVLGKECTGVKGIKVNRKEIEKLDGGVRKIVEDFIAPDEGYYSIPRTGLNSLDVSFYMNHSDKPNMDMWYSNKCGYTLFRTNRRIKKGEELTINYSLY